MAWRVSPEVSSSSYKQSGHDDFVLIHVDSGPPRMRKDKAKSNPVIDLTWNVFSADFLTLMYAYEHHRNTEWEISLFSVEDGYGSYNCQLIPGTFSWRPHGDAAFSVTCSVEVLGSA